jgi:carboxyl-terminal processing protease
VGYLRIAQFNRKAADEFEEALDNLDPGMKGLVVDLRSNPGGVLSETLHEVDGMEPVRALLSRLTPGGKVAMLERKPKQKAPMTVDAQEPSLSLPLVVLVDRGTAGLSELAASALREAGKAKIVGSRTFGDDILPLFAVFKNGSGVEMSTARLFTASGAEISQGIAPDIEVVENAGNDAVLRRALALLGA